MRLVILCAAYRDGAELARDLGHDPRDVVIVSAASSRGEKLRGLSGVTFVEAPGYRRADLMRRRRIEEEVAVVLCTGGRYLRVRVVEEIR